jgi:hypothetical protein
MGLSIEKGHIAGLQNFLLNMSLVVTLGLFAGLMLRSLVLLALDRHRPARVQALRALAAAAFLIFGTFNFIFASNMLVWDRPPRAVFAALAVSFPLLAFARIKKDAIRHPAKRDGVYVAAMLMALCLASVLTLLRAGMVALTGDRVTLTVEVTGQAVGENGAPENGADTGRTAVRHVVVWLPSGERLTDIWLPAERMRVEGRVYRISEGLHRLGFPNFYQFLSVEGDTLAPNGDVKTVAAALPLVAHGPLGIHPWWRPIEKWLLDHWESTTRENSFFSLRTAPNASPFYPLVDGQGRALRETFLLVLPPSGNATSRGSSPLERNPPASY